MHGLACRLGKAVFSTRKLSPNVLLGQRHLSSSSFVHQSEVSSVKLYQTNDSLHFSLCCSNSDSSSETSDRPYILTPSKSLPPVEEMNELTITQQGLVDSIASSIESHYAIENSKGQFVGGMGESDGGVWISSEASFDTLHYWEHIRDIILQVKQNRHGIPFGVYTSGIIKDMEIATQLEGEIGLSTIQVSLISSNPEGYAAVRGINDLTKAQQDFGQVCNFIATAAESGFPVSVAVAGGKHASGGSELAKALGAVDVIVYDNIGI